VHAGILSPKCIVLRIGKRAVGLDDISLPGGSPGCGAITGGVTKAARKYEDRDKDEYSGKSGEEFRE
jgi:hypothetical protein